MNSLVWFRKCLRVHDNIALSAAAEESDQVFPVFVIDPMVLSKMSLNRRIFLFECIQDLDKTLRERYQTKLYIAKGNPLEIIPSLVVKLGITKIYTEKECETNGELLEKQLKPILSSLGVQSKFAFNHTLYDLDLLLKTWNDNPPLSFELFTQKIEEFGPPSCSTSCIRKIPTPGEVDPKVFLPSANPADFDAEILRNGSCKPAAIGGETYALKQLSKTVGNPDWVGHFEKGQTNPATIVPDTSLLSPYFAYGALSPKLYYEVLQTTYRTSKKLSPNFSASLLSQLYWREYFIIISYSFPNFDTMAGNPVCRQIEWGENQTFLEAWRTGKTGYPWIDACVSQMLQTGWLHHLARHSLSCFLTRGDLWLHWEAGRDCFMEYMIDYDWSLNNANWMWMSGSGFESPVMMIYSPTEFGKKYDLEGKYIRHYVPVLKDFPEKYIYEPWKAPLEVQQAANCIIGKDYPLPIVDHATSWKQNILKMRECHLKMKGKPFPNGDPIKRHMDSESTSSVSCLKRKREELISLLSKHGRITSSLSALTAAAEVVDVTTSDSNESSESSTPSPDSDSVSKKTKIQSLLAPTSSKNYS